MPVTRKEGKCKVTHFVAENKEIISKKCMDLVSGDWTDLDMKKQELGIKAYEW